MPRKFVGRYMVCGYHSAMSYVTPISVVVASSVYTAISQ